MSQTASNCPELDLKWSRTREWAVERGTVLPMMPRTSEVIQREEKRRRTRSEYQRYDEESGVKDSLIAVQPTEF